MATINLGKVKVTPEGQYDPSKSYAELSLVGHEGSSYISIQDVPAGVSPTNTAYWQLHGSKGADGTNGADGNDGIDAYQPFKGWYDDSTTLSTAFPSPQVGDYAFVAGSTASDPVTVYKCTTAGTWAASSSVFNPANNQSFQTGQDLDQTKIINDPATGGANHVLSAEAGKTINAKVSALGPKIDKAVKPYDDSENILSICDGNGNVIASFNNGFEITSGGHIVIKNGFSSMVIGALSSLTTQEKSSIVAAINELNNKEVVIDDSGLAKIYDDDNSILSICDGRGNIIVKLNNSISISKPLSVNGNLSILSDGTIKTDNFDSSYFNAARTQFPKIDLKKTPLRILDIGNSHSLCTEAYLPVIMESQEVDISDIAWCCISRGAASFKSFVQGWHDEDTSGEGDELTGGQYMVNKLFGGVDVKVSGNIYTAGQWTSPTAVVDRSLTSNNLICWGGDTSIIRDLLTRTKFDIIIIHQQNGYLEYESSSRWRDSGDFGYLTELIRLLKVYQPNATVAYLYPLIYFNYYNQYRTLQQMDACHNKWCETLRKFKADSGVDYIIPSGTALLNLRHSSCLETIDTTQYEDLNVTPSVMRPFEQSSDFDGGVANYETRYGLHYDGAHTAWGIAAYTMSCAIYEFLFAPRFDKSILGNSYREGFKDLYFNELHHLYLKPMRHRSEDAEGVMVECSTYTTFSAELGWSQNRHPTIRVTDSNAEICQKAAILAVNDMWGINNPDNIII